jgi:hypothetical protein
MAKIDLYKLYKDEFVTPKMPAILKLRPAQYLAIEGKGEPGGEAFSEALGHLYPVAFTLKMGYKAKQDYAVAKLEGLWWAAKHPFADQPRSEWLWRLLIRTPEFITKKDVAQTVEKLIAKGKPEHVRRVALEPMNEGTVVQVLHTGPFSEEAKTIAAMHEFAVKEGYELTGHHHEIYLTDFRRVAPAKLRTILRHPLRRA